MLDIMLPAAARGVHLSLNKGSLLKCFSSRTPTFCRFLQGSETVSKRKEKCDTSETLLRVRDTLAVWVREGPTPGRGTNTNL
jgi:hypothetical protein